MEGMSAGPIILAYNAIRPTIHPDAWVAPSAVIIGDVHIGANSNIWFGCVVRGDVNSIRIGERTNIQDGTIVHVTRKTSPTHIGSGVTIGHRALLHGCSIEHDCFIGMGATVMDDAVVESGAYLGAGAQLTPGKRVPSGQMWVGNPAKYFRDVRDEEAEFIGISAQNYVHLAKEYR
jgi:carbonic anhydrase/acetyltransferase-like protein (isoleucine patch superfamily)